MFSHEVQIGDLVVGQNHPVRIMGVINLSPESFYGESVAQSENDLKGAVNEMTRAGVDIIDIGGASTAPEAIYGARETSLEKELERVVWAMEILKAITEIPFSIDTTSSKIAEAALDMGAVLVNDVSGLQQDDRMVDVVSTRRVPAVLMAHCKPSCNSLDDSMTSLRKSMDIALKGGIDRSRVVLDPGIGFGKPPEADLRLLRELGRFSILRQPILVGLSRKAFIGAVLEQEDPHDRLIGTIAATTIAVANGASIIRAHDVKEAKLAAKMGEAVRKHRTQANDNVILLDIQDEKESEIAIEQLGAQSTIKKFLSRKSITLNFLIQNASPPAALIIKQEMLSLGGDAAYHHDTIDFGIDRTDILVMGTLLQIRRLVKKLSGMKYFGLEGIATSMRVILEEREEKLG
ncbi:MAG: dihydropteroate synthase [Candidatus Thorarchaeota archaeon]|nr:dihydropteroate synthase [Candidatus Thorarchaeota archaeon]